MTKKWLKTAHKGLRYFEHETRKHGKQQDRYYAIRFRVDRVLHTYGVGWMSDGIPETIRKEEPGLGFQDYCLKLLRQYKNAVKTGAGPTSPKEKRTIEEARKEAERQAYALAEAEGITFGQYFEKVYFPTFEVGRKNSTTRKGKEHFQNWIEPVIGNIPLKDVKPFAIEKIKKNVLDAGKSARSLQYIFATIRQAWNHARRDGLVSGDSPTKSVRIPKIDNRRVRFLSHKEAETLLNALQEKDTLAHDLALLSLHTGARVGEMAALQWGHVDTERGMIRIMDPKGGKGRTVYMTESVKAMFDAMERGKPEGYVFTRKEGERLNDMPRIFFEVVAGLGFNDGITDPRQKVVAHTLRHTFASWHVTAGTDIYTLKELLGHSVIQMTERYSHLAPGTLQDATRTLERVIESAAQEKAEADSGQVVNLKK